jgi:hypothetical protein
MYHYILILTRSANGEMHTTPLGVFLYTDVHQMLERASLLRQRLHVPVIINYHEAIAFFNQALEERSISCEICEGLTAFRNVAYPTVTIH